MFAGYGITAPELAWDDYDGLDVAGKLVLRPAPRPHENAESGPWSEPGDHGLFLSKARNAQKHGAAGMLLVTDPVHHDGPEDFRSGSLRRDLPEEAPQQAEAEPDESEPFLAAHVSRGTAEALVGERSLRELQEALDRGDDVNGALDVEVSLEVASRDPVEVQAHNVVAFLEGADPELRDEWIVVGGHYDHIGAFEAEGGDTVYNGADDNASGTSGVLALARALATQPTPPARSVVFVGFSGEEKGLLGSRAIVEEGIIDPERVVYMLNLDMIGRPTAGRSR